MTPEHWKEVSRLYDAARALPQSDRAAFLASECGSDSSLRRVVQSLLDQPTSPPGLEGLTPSVVMQALADAPRPPLTGRRLGDYVIGEWLDSGGMGDVYRARDTRLGRDVAIKVIPAEFANEPARLARFDREARLLAALDHPHIGTIYGIEEREGMRALVLGLVEGETLASRIARGAIPMRDALEYARQITEALEAAHNKGIVHRDLKPANIKITPTGSIKVLDFGLAIEPQATDRGLTRTGLVMGTAPYMSPEQAKGERVDRRTDIWAFGCVLYEMLTGHQAFARGTVAETVAAVLEDEPRLSSLPRDTTPAVRMVLDRCLRKDPKDRIRDIGDVQLALAGAFGMIATTSLRRPWWQRAGVVVAALAAMLLAIAAASLLNTPADITPRIARLSLSTRGEAALFVEGNDQELAITPDGSRVVYVGDDGRRLFVRALDQLEPVTIATGPLIKNPFISPDGQWVGYCEGISLLKKVSITGGPPVSIATMGSVLRGAVWLADNTIVFSTESRAAGLQRVSADGGVPETLTMPDVANKEYDHYWPAALPDGTGILYTILSRTGGLGAARIAVYDLQTKASTELLSAATNAVHLRSGHLVYIAGGTLWAVAFDANRRAITGTAVPVLKQMFTTGNGAGNFGISESGTLAYLHTSGFDPFARTLSWVDRNGTLQPIDAPQHPYMQPRISHDGTRIVHATGRSPENNPWILDVSRHTLAPLRTEAARDQNPSWSPDDKWILFASDRTSGDLLQIWRHAADGTGEPELLVESGVSPIVTPDGGQLVYVAAAGPRDNDILQMALDGSRHVRPLVRTPFSESGAEISPDQRWLAYWSNSSGRQEVYVSPYPNASSSRLQLSTSGGVWPLWSHDGRELFYMAADGALMGIQVKATASTWAATTPVKILEPGYWSNPRLIGRQYDVSPDGTRFLVVTPPKVVDHPPELVVVQNWDAELKMLVRSK